MQKYVVILYALLFVMSENMMGMQILKSLSCNKNYPIVTANRRFNDTYNESVYYTTFMISQLGIEIAKLEHQKKRLENIGIHDLKDEKTIERYYEIKMHKELIQKDKRSLHRCLDSFWKTPKDVVSIE